MGDLRIKPCPFCGSHIVDICRTNVHACWVQCADCGAETSGDEEGTREGAIRFWNKRCADDGLGAAVEDDGDASWNEWWARHYALKAEDRTPTPKEGTDE
jgi:hypothetical protein